MPAGEKGSIEFLTHFADQPGLKRNLCALYVLYGKKQPFIRKARLPACPAINVEEPPALIMPQLGESIAEATVINLLIKIGDKVKADQDVIEVETNKATMNVSSPCPGLVQELKVKLNESYPVGAVLGYPSIRCGEIRTGASILVFQVFSGPLQRFDGG